MRTPFPTGIFFHILGLGQTTTTELGTTLAWRRYLAKIVSRAIRFFPQPQSNTGKYQPPTNSESERGFNKFPPGFIFGL
jgi:hypothetical protein